MTADPQSSNPSPDELLSLVAHELRGSLTGVSGILELAVTPGSMIEPEELPDMLALAHRESLQMAGVLENLLIRSRLATGKLALELVPVSLVEAVRSTLDIFPEVAKRTVVAVPAGVAVKADPRALRQILQNLVQNVNRYAPTGEVEIRAEPVGNEIVLTVSDEGPGLPTDGEGPRRIGLGIGLRLATELAVRQGGDLSPVPPLRSGATFALRLAATSETPIADPVLAPVPATLTPRARLLNDLSEALGDRNLDRTMIGIGELAKSILGSSMVSMFVGTNDGMDVYGPAATIRPAIQTSDLPDTCVSPELARLEENLLWLTELGIDRAYHWRVTTAEGREACLVVGFDPGVKPDERLAQEILPGIGRIAAIALDRSDLEAEVTRQRRLRSSVLESLPLAISVFEGDPPVLIDMNRKEREMLGIEEDSSRATSLSESQEQFSVRFADGTPLTVDNAPVTEAVRSGRSQGPFFLILRRADGSEIHTRTHCAPFFDETGAVAGAVVTSEQIDPQLPD